MILPPLQKPKIFTSFQLSPAAKEIDFEKNENFLTARNPKFRSPTLQPLPNIGPSEFLKHLAITKSNVAAESKE